MSTSRFVKLSIAIIFSSTLLYGYVFYAMSTGAAFNAFQEWCMSSQRLVAIAGNFQKVELLPFESFFEKDKGHVGVAGFTARIVGSTKTVDVKVLMTRSGDKWEVERILLHGKRLDTE